MKKITIIFIAILLVILVVTLKNSFSINVKPKNTSTPIGVIIPTSSEGNQNESVQNKNNSNGLETKENTQGPVSITVTPQTLESSSPTWDFDVTLNTHSEELNEDMVSMSELVDDQGKLYKPLSWEGSPPGGHHRQGILKFNPILPKPKFIEIKIKNIGEIAVRSFKWKLQ